MPISYSSRDRMHNEAHYSVSVISVKLSSMMSGVPTNWAP
nr:MAG TPA: hypothetical protein [Caudoviricetes sp.]